MSTQFKEIIIYADLIQFKKFFLSKRIFLVYNFFLIKRSNDFCRKIFLYHFYLFINFLHF